MRAQNASSRRSRATPWGLSGAARLEIQGDLSHTVERTVTGRASKT